ncbi:MAG: DedA protein [Acidobacteriaceae bacterium]|jgi:membrane protein DedA with SNARE-associated domain/rhodanese-related sulfurtransferase|nr:DedA protein [Acidobacteriaceae bacterium]
MPLALDFFIHHAYIILFAWIAAEQIGLPIPSVPLLLTAGTLSATHQLSLPLVLLSSVAACLLSDSLWYALGARHGGVIVRMVCKLSFESAACVRRTGDFFQRWGARALLLAKFIPGLGAVAAPIAGQSRMPYATFATYDIAGALLWSLTATLIGRFFGDVLNRHPGALGHVGHSAGLLFILLLLGFFGYRIYRQRAFLRQIRGAKIEPEELKTKLDAGENVYIIDLRHPLDYLPDPRRLPGAVLFNPDTLVAEGDRIPRDQDIVLYCTCPSDATSARTALRLRNLGVYRVRPLHGGYDGWKRLGYPLEPMEQKTVA